jgi:hypothetical protein
MSMNQQEIFDAVTQHLLTQNAQARAGGRCVYRGKNGLRCAIGGILPDLLYVPSMEGRTALSLMENYPKVAEYFGADNTQFLDGLQEVHDLFSPQDWRSELAVIAAYNGLTFNPPAALSPS